jgi:Protein of unknown function (DUF2408)
LWKKSRVLPNLEAARDYANLNRQGKIDERFQETYDKLNSIRNHLEKLFMTKAWSLRETDLYTWHRKLDRIDDSRRDGNFFDAEGKPADLHAQRVGLELPETVHGLTATDTALSSSKKLCIHLPTAHIFRACLRSSTSSVQSTAHPSKMPH